MKERLRSGYALDFQVSSESNDCDRVILID